jgi:DDE_Tnp_1-associated
MLGTVPEPRRRCGIRHRAAVVLAFAVAAMLAGADSVTAIAERAADAPPQVLVALGAWQDRRGRRAPRLIRPGHGRHTQHRRRRPAARRIHRYRLGTTLGRT